MNDKKYFVNHEGQQQGPHSVDEIVDLVKNQKLNIMDYIYDEDVSDWVLMMDFKLLKDHLSKLKPSKPPGVEKEPTVKSEKETPTDKEQEDETVEWFVLKGENKFGPFAYVEVVKMLQEKSIFEFDFIWNAGLMNWTRIAEIDEFMSKNIEKLKSSVMPEISEVFFRRRHKRVKFGGSILIHDNQSLWKGHAVEISSGGAGIMMNNSVITPGQKLYLHFQPGDGVPPFNAVCEVVGKSFDEGVKSKDSQVKYNLKFINISEGSEKAIQTYSEQGIAS